MVKKLGIALLVLLILIAAGLGWMWLRITALPGWYEQGATLAEDGSPRVDDDWVQIPEAERPAGAPAGAEVFVLRNPHLRNPKRSPIEQAIKQSRATYSGGRIEAGAVINMSEAELDTLSPAERERMQDTIDAFPALTERDVYVGVEGGVEGADGKLAIGPDTKLRIGNTRYSLKAAAKRMKMSEAELRGLIEDELLRMQVAVPEE